MEPFGSMPANGIQKSYKHHRFRRNPTIQFIKQSNLFIHSDVSGVENFRLRFVRLLRLDQKFNPTHTHISILINIASFQLVDNRINFGRTWR